MTGATEAKLFREAEICYATLNLATDYDVWHAEEETVSVELILENLRLNIGNAKAHHPEGRGRPARTGPGGPAAAARPSGTRSSPTRPSFPGRPGKARPLIVGRYLP